MKIYVARHGETAYNAEEKVCGVTDIPLTEKGMEQAESLAEQAAQHPGITLMIVSPLLRAQQTAEAVLRRCPMEKRTDSRLREQNYGFFEGCGREEADFRAARLEFAKPFPQGESLFQMAQRIYNFLDGLISEESAEEVLLVAHGSVARVIRSYFLPLSNEEYMNFYQKNCALEVYEVKSSK